MMGNTRIILFGAGAMGGYMLEKLSLKGISVDCIIDNDPARQNGVRYGTPLCPPSMLARMRPEEVFVLIAVGDEAQRAQITAQLRGYGLAEHRDFCHGLDLLQRPERRPGQVPGLIALDGAFEVRKSYTASSRIIHKRDEKRIFRAFDGLAAENFAAVLQGLSGTALPGGRMVDVTAARDQVPGFSRSLIYEMEFLEPINYSSEWSPLMFRDNCLWMLDFFMELDKAGLAVSDVHPLNVAFHKGAFRFFDLEALEAGKMTPAAFADFMNSFLVPLLLLSKGQIIKAGLFLNGMPLNSAFADVEGYLDTGERAVWNKLADSCRRLAVKGDLRALCGELGDYVRSLNFFSMPQRWWQRLDQNRAVQARLLRDKGVLALAQKAAPRTLIELCGSLGALPEALSRQSDYLISVEYDPGTADETYRRVLERGLSKVVPLNFDLLAPPLATHEGQLIDSRSGIRPWQQGAAERLRCDLALALDLTPRLVFMRHLDFDEIAATFKRWTRRWLLTEYPDDDSQAYARNQAEGFAWYNRENFELALGRDFDIVKRLRPEGAGAMLYLCELKASAKQEQEGKGGI
ncbi:hypothetical protein LJC15_02975 [Desulfovibrio sp. OttesenSCG-928-G11]|nr:hypothetical protein [Desulfovibrio sp. OttesenSCG-928-G11]